MFYYIKQPRNSSFPIGLVKTASDFVVRSVETGLGRWKLVIAVISVDTYPFLVFSDLTCHLKDTGINVFGCTVQSDSKKTKLEVVTKRLLHQQVKI